MPARVIRLATSLAEIGVREPDLRSCLAQPKYGITAVMRRADERRSASVMISSSIRWSLAGNEVDWMMKASEPRTFSRISTKISLSAKRRTLALASGRFSQLAISCARAGLELPATSLIEPFLAAIDASPRALLDTTFSISRNPREPARFDERGDIRRVAWLATRRTGFPGQKKANT